MGSHLKITSFKTATYAIMHFAIAIAVAYALTGSWELALAIGLIEPFVQTFAFAIHEALWNRAISKRNPVEGTAATPLRGPGVNSTNN